MIIEVIKKFLSGFFDGSKKGNSNSLPFNKDQETYVFLQDGKYCLVAARSLFNSGNPFNLFPGAILCHHGMELVLKGCFAWDQSRSPQYVHKLLSIAKPISFLNLTTEYSNLLEKIDTFYSFRYPLDQNEAEEVNKRLLRIEGRMDGSDQQVSLAREIGTDDWEKVETFHQYLVEAMPKELREIYIGIQTSLSS